MHRTREGDLRGNKMSEFCGVAQVACLKKTVKMGGISEKGGPIFGCKLVTDEYQSTCWPKRSEIWKSSYNFGGGELPSNDHISHRKGSLEDHRLNGACVCEGILLMEEIWRTTWDRENPVNNPPVVGSLSHHLWGFSNIPGGCLGKSSIICRVSCMLRGCLGFLNHQQYHPQPFQMPLSSNCW